MVRRLNPKRIKMQLEDGTLRWTKVRAVLPKSWRGKPLSDFQRKRLGKAVTVAVAYLKGNVTVHSLATAMNVTHQRVSQMTRLGTEVLLAVGRIKERGGPEGDTGGQTTGEPSGSPLQTVAAEQRPGQLL